MIFKHLSKVKFLFVINYFGGLIYLRPFFLDRKTKKKRKHVVFCCIKNVNFSNCLTCIFKENYGFVKGLETKL